MRLPLQFLLLLLALRVASSGGQALHRHGSKSGGRCRPRGVGGGPRQAGPTCQDTAAIPPVGLGWAAHGRLPSRPYAAAGTRELCSEPGRLGGARPSK